MRRRTSLGRALASAMLLSLPAVACTDEPPTVVGVDLFPGTLPSTFQVVLPADSFAQRIGTYSGYTGPADVGYQLVANGFDGGVTVNTLVRLGGFPATITYTQGGTSRSDTAFTYGRGTLVARLDSVASTSAGPVQLQLWEAGQAWDPGSASWRFAVDTVGERTAWTQPGGSRGALLASASLTAGARAQGDSVVFALDSLTVRRLASLDFRGLLVTAAGSPARVQLSGFQLRTGAHPQNAAPDTLVPVNVPVSRATFVFDPDQPSSGGAAWEAGGIRSARTLFRVRLPATLPVCRQGSCTAVPLRDVTLNEVSLLLRPVDVPGGYRPVGPVATALRRVSEPELGRRAPLGSTVNEVLGFDITARPIFAGSRFVPGEDLAIPFTTFASGRAASDSTQFALALLSDPGTLFGNAGALAFGPAWFAPEPRLRIVYTLSARPSLP